MSRFFDSSCAGGKKCSTARWCLRLPTILLSISDKADNPDKGYSGLSLLTNFCQGCFVDDCRALTATAADLCRPKCAHNGPRQNNRGKSAEGQHHANVRPATPASDRTPRQRDVLSENSARAWLQIRFNHSHVVHSQEAKTNPDNSPQDASQTKIAGNEISSCPSRALFFDKRAYAPTISTPSPQSHTDPR
jgi:hypothetical protein